MSVKARFRGGPRDGETLTAEMLPAEVRYVARTTVADCDWEHAYTLRGTPEAGMVLRARRVPARGAPERGGELPVVRRSASVAGAGGQTMTLLLWLARIVLAVCVVIVLAFVVDRALGPDEEPDEDEETERLLGGFRE